MACRENRRDLPVFISICGTCFLWRFISNGLHLLRACVCVTWHDEHSLTMNYSDTWCGVTFQNIMWNVKRKRIMRFHTMSRLCIWYVIASIHLNELIDRLFIRFLLFNNFFFLLENLSLYKNCFSTPNNRVCDVRVIGSSLTRESHW